MVPADEDERLLPTRLGPGGYLQGLVDVYRERTAYAHCLRLELIQGSVQFSHPVQQVHQSNLVPLQRRPHHFEPKRFGYGNNLEPDSSPLSGLY